MKSLALLTIALVSGPLLTVIDRPDPELHPITDTATSPECSKCEASATWGIQDSVIECAPCTGTVGIPASLSVTFLGVPTNGDCQWMTTPDPHCDPQSKCQQQYQIDILIPTNSCFYGRGVWVQVPGGGNRAFKNATWGTTFTQEATCKTAGADVDPGKQTDAVRIFCGQTGGTAIAQYKFTLTCQPCEQKDR